MKNNNGKIAIAIVAMFVVALSIVGFTYAYFTATVVGNKSERPSVTVEAGKLEITYEYGRSIVAPTIVPGWASDGDMIYDPVHSMSVVGGENRITAKSAKELGATKSGNATDPVEPAVFSVTNTGTRDAAYSISLTNIINNIADKENVRFKVEAARAQQKGLKQVDVGEEKADDINYVDITSQVSNVSLVDGKQQLSASGVQELFASVTVPANKADYYRITLYYLEANTDQSDSANLNSSNENENLRKAISLDVDVTGLGQDKVTTTSTQTQE